MKWNVLYSLHLPVWKELLQEKKCNPEKGAKLCSLVVSRGIDGGPQKKKKKIDCSWIQRLVLSVQRVSELVVGICPEKCKQ